MTAETQLLASVLSIELVLLAVAAVLYLAHGFWLAAARGRLVDRMAVARRALMLALAAPDGRLPPQAALRRLPEPAQLELIAELAHSLGGAMNARLGGIADALGLTSRAERRCRSRLWWRRLHAVRLLTLVGRGDGLVPALLADRNADVRAEAAAWASDHPEPATAWVLVQLLERDRRSRFAVQDALLRLGDRAAPAVAAYLETNHGDAVVPALRVAAGLAAPAFVGPGLRLAGDPSPLVRAASADLLGATGGEAAVDALVRLTSDPNAAVRRAAARALAKLDHWPAAGRLADLLADADWDVRREAALALSALGPTGELLLGQAARLEDTPAGAMARLVLATPDTA